MKKYLIANSRWEFLKNDGTISRYAINVRYFDTKEQAQMALDSLKLDYTHYVTSVTPVILDCTYG